MNKSIDGNLDSKEALLAEFEQVATSLKQEASAFAKMYKYKHDARWQYAAQPFKLEDESIVTVFKSRDEDDSDVRILIEEPNGRNLLFMRKLRYTEMLISADRKGGQPVVSVHKQDAKDKYESISVVLSSEEPYNEKDDWYSPEDENLEAYEQTMNMMQKYIPLVKAKADERSEELFAEKLANQKRVRENALAIFSK